MAYRVFFSDQAAKEIKKLDSSTKLLLQRWLQKHLVGCENPRAYGKGLTADKTGLWRYRIGSYRLICQIQDEKLIVLALTFGHRSDVYNN